MLIVGLNCIRLVDQFKFSLSSSVTKQLADDLLIKFVVFVKALNHLVDGIRGKVDLVISCQSKVNVVPLLCFFFDLINLFFSTFV